MNTNIMKTKKGILTFLAVLGAAGIFQSAPVVAGKVLYPASMCVRFNSGHVIPYLSHSRIFNQSTTQEMYVDCPILHFNFSRYGNNIDDADVGIIDNNTTRDAKCWLTSRFQVSTKLYGSSHSRNSHSAGSHEQNLDFDGTSRNDQNWYYLGCEIPRKQAGRVSGITYYSAED